MINKIQFKIYTKDKRFHLSENKVVYSLLLGFIGMAYLANLFLSGSVIEDVGRVGGVFTCVIMLYFTITNATKRKPLNGKLNKKLVFKKDEIWIDDDKYELNEIKKIRFNVEDYFNRIEGRIRGDLSPGRSNGTANICELTLMNGQKIEVNFQLMYETEFLKMRELLIKYYTENKIHFLKLIEYLGIEKYEEIQEFKKTLPSISDTACAI